MTQEWAKADANLTKAQTELQKLITSKAQDLTPQVKATPVNQQTADYLADTNAKLDELNALIDSGDLSVVEQHKTLTSNIGKVTKANQSVFDLQTKIQNATLELNEATAANDTKKVETLRTQIVNDATKLKTAQDNLAKLVTPQTQDATPKAEPSKQFAPIKANAEAAITALDQQIENLRTQDEDTNADEIENLTDKRYAIQATLDEPEDIDAQFVPLKQAKRDAKGNAKAYNAAKNKVDKLSERYKRKKNELDKLLTPPKQQEKPAPENYTAPEGSEVANELAAIRQRKSELEAQGQRQNATEINNLNKRRDRIQDGYNEIADLNTNITAKRKELDNLLNPRNEDEEPEEHHPPVNDDVKKALEDLDEQIAAAKDSAEEENLKRKKREIEAQNDTASRKSVATDNSRARNTATTIRISTNRTTEKATVARNLLILLTTISITADDVRHIKNHHGESEDQRGQIDLTPETIAEIYDVVNNFDSATKERTDVEGNQSMMVVKKDDGTSYVLLIERGKSKAQVKTFYKHKGASQMFDAKSPNFNAQSDSVTAPKSEVETSNENIPQTEQSDNNEPAQVEKQVQPSPQGELVYPDGALTFGDKSAVDEFKGGYKDKKFDENNKREVTINGENMTRLEAVEGMAKGKLDESAMKLNKRENKYLGWLRKNLIEPLKKIQQAGIQNEQASKIYDGTVDNKNVYFEDIKKDTATLNQLTKLAETFSGTAEKISREQLCLNSQHRQTLGLLNVSQIFSCTMFISTILIPKPFKKPTSKEQSWRTKINQRTFVHKENLRRAKKNLDKKRRNTLNRDNISEQDKQEISAIFDAKLKEAEQSLNFNYPSGKYTELKQKISQMTDEKLRAKAEDFLKYFDTNFEKELKAVSDIEELIRRDKENQASANDENASEKLTPKEKIERTIDNAVDKLKAAHNFSNQQIKGIDHLGGVLKSNGSITVADLGNEVDLSSF